MFFIAGISNGEKKLDYVQNTFCSKCESFGRIEVYMTYLCFNLFLSLSLNGTRSFILNTLVAIVYIF